LKVLNRIVIVACFLVIILAFVIIIGSIVEFYVLQPD